MGPGNPAPDDGSVPGYARLATPQGVTCEGETLMAWVILIGSGVLEAVWATALGRSDGLKRPVPTVVFIVAGVLSLVGLGTALATLPTGTAYAVWTATGASLTVAWAMLTGAESASVKKVLLLTGIVVSVVGLKVIS